MEMLLQSMEHHSQTTGHDAVAVSRQHKCGDVVELCLVLSEEHNSKETLLDNSRPQ